MSEDFYVYLHRKRSSGEVFYVGKGCRNRSNSQKSRNPLWRKIVAKHGLVIEIAFSNLQEWAAFEIEADLISLYGRRDKNSGTLVNMSDGGDGLANPSDSVRQKLSNKAKVRFSDPTTRASLLVQLDNARNDPGSLAKRLSVFADKDYKDQHAKRMKAMHADPEFKVRFLEAARKKVISDESRARMAIHLKSLHATEEFRASRDERTRRLNADPEFKQRAADRMRARIQDPTFVQKLTLARSAAISRSVRCLETDTQFKSATDAADWLMLTVPGVKSRSSGRSAIGQCCKHKRITAYGYHWQYAESSP